MARISIQPYHPYLPGAWGKGQPVCRVLLFLHRGHGSKNRPARCTKTQREISHRIPVGFDARTCSLPDKGDCGRPSGLMRSLLLGELHQLPKTDPIALIRFPFAPQRPWEMPSFSGYTRGCSQGSSGAVVNSPTAHHHCSLWFKEQNTTHERVRLGFRVLETVVGAAQLFNRCRGCHQLRSVMS